MCQEEFRAMEVPIDRGIGQCAGAREGKERGGETVSVRSMSTHPVSPHPPFLAQVWVWSLRPSHPAREVHAVVGVCKRSRGLKSSAACALGAFAQKEKARTNATLESPFQVSSFGDVALSSNPSVPKV